MNTFDFNKLKREIEKQLKVIAENGEERLKESVGKLYPPASTPGQPPAKRTGELQAQCSETSHELTITVKSEAPYAEYEEFGTSKLAPRPHVRPEVTNVIKDINAMTKKLTIKI